MCYGLDHRETGVRFPADAKKYSLLHSIRTGTVTHPAYYPMGTRVSFSRDKATVV
jgi:hypothetical protein